MMQKKTFTSGIDSDTADELLPEGRDRYRLNVRVLCSDNSTVGAIETVNGNTIVNHTLPTGTNTCIGSIEDKQRKLVYAFIHNSLGEHSIIEYNYELNTISNVLIDDSDVYLRFRKDNLITGINIVELDKDNHLLYWTDNYVNPSDLDDYNEPKKINIEKAKYYTAGNYTLGYPNVSPSELWEFFHRAKQPPLVAPEVFYSDDDDFKVNFLTDKLFRFKAKFVYDDYEESRWSPISIYAQPDCECGNELSTKNNNIMVMVPTGIEIVKRIKISAEQYGTNDFVLIADLDKEELGIPSNGVYTYSFYNNGTYTPIDINDSIQLYDRVPKRSQAQELIKGIRLVDGNITEEFNPVSVDMKMDVSFAEDITEPTFTIRGKIYIPSLRQNAFGSYFNKCQPIWYSDETPGNIAWGGIGYNLFVSPGIATWVEGMTHNIVSYAQTLPLGGFYVYLVGTDYSTISYQVDTGQGVSSQGAYFLGATSDLILPPDQLGEVQVKMSNEETYSRFVLEAPPGTYVMRISNQPDQNTSTYTCGVGGYSMTECLITIGNDGTITIPGVGTYPQGVDIPDSYVLDMTTGISQAALPRYSVLYGYVKDIDLTPVELAEVELNRYDSVTGNLLTGNTANTALMGLYNGWGNAFVQDYIDRLTATGSTDPYVQITDHNGFFWHAVNQDPYPGETKIQDIVVGGFSRLFSPVNVVDNDLAVLTYPTFTTIDNNVKTHIEGYVISNGNPIGGAVVVTTRGRYARTDSDGFYRLPIFTDTNSLVRTDKLLCYLDGNCIAIFDSSGQQDYTINFGVNPLYNWNNPYLAASFLIQAIIGSSPANALKRRGTYTVGIIYYDHVNRSGLTNINNWDYNEQFSVNNRWGTNLYIPFYTEIDPLTTNIYGGSYPLLSYQIFNQAPAWATHYQIAMTRNSANGRYIDFVTQGVQYLNENGAVTSFSGTNGPPTQVKLIISNIYTLYKDANSNSILTYDFIKGDRITFIKNAAGVFYSDYYDMEIKSFDSGTGTIIVQISNSMPELTQGVLFEIYNLKEQTPVDQLIIYEVGECNPITKVGNYYIHEVTGGIDQLIWNATSFEDDGGGFLQITGLTNHNLNPTDYVRINNPDLTSVETNTYGTITATPTTDSIVLDIPYTGGLTAASLTVVRGAIGNIVGGDTYYRFRTMPDSVNNKKRLIEDAGFSDFYDSKAWFFGRPNRIDPTIKEITRPTTIYYSNALIPETQINGLSSVYDNNFETYEGDYGGIYKLYSENDNLIMFRELRVGNIPVERIIYDDLQGMTTVGASTSILSPQAMYYSGEFGIGKNPESFAVYGTSKYFMDLRRGTPCRLSVDGITPIGTVYFQQNNFTDLSQIALKSSLVKVYGVYDIKFNEYVLAVASFGYEGTNGKVTYPGATIAFSEKANAWSTFYSYLPENMCAMGINILTLKSGRIYTHNTNALQNYFYGTQYNSEVWSVMNDNPSNVKVLEAISEETNDAWEVYSITTPNGQSSNLIVADFVEKENNQYADVLRDVNTPNLVAGTQLFEGDVMRDRTFLAKFRHSGSAYNKLFALNFLYILSDRSNK